MFFTKLFLALAIALLASQPSSVDLAPPNQPPITDFFNKPNGNAGNAGNAGNVPPQPTSRPPTRPRIAAPSGKILFLKF